MRRYFNKVYQGKKNENIGYGLNFWYLEIWLDIIIIIIAIRLTIYVTILIMVVV